LRPGATGHRRAQRRCARSVWLLRGGALSNVHFHEGVEDPLAGAAELLAHWRALATHTDPAQALREANRLRLLTACAKARRARAASTPASRPHCAARASAARHRMWFPGRLLLITENSYRHGLFNGDVGTLPAR
jgi:exodeoxyribonuclease V alpha subunit